MRRDRAYQRLLPPHTLHFLCLGKGPGLHGLHETHGTSICCTATLKHATGSCQSLTRHLTHNFGANCTLLLCFSSCQIALPVIIACDNYLHYPKTNT